MSFYRTVAAGRASAAIASAIALFSIVGPARAQAPKPDTKAKAVVEPVSDPRAQALLDEVAKAYKGLSSYSDEGQFVLELTIDGKVQKQAQNLRLSFTRPNKLNLDTGIVQVVSDGKTFTTSVAPLKKYTETPAPKVVTFDTFREGPLGSILFGGPSAGPMFVLTNLLTGDNAAAEIGKLGGVVKMADSGDPKSTTLLLDKPDGADFRIVVDPKTKLLSAIDVLIDAESLAKNIKDGKQITIGKFGWSAGTVSIQPIKDSLFAFAPLKGFEKVDSFQAEGGPGDGEEKYAVDEKVGKPAPDFTLTVLDGPGKTKTLTKADLAGKVVLIDFWATWCPPCMKEMPEVQKLAENYAKAKKDVVIVALSQDDETKDPVELRKLIETTLSERKIATNSLIGMDPSKSVGEAFAIEGLPTVVILDGKGIVQAAHVGYNPEVLQTLTKNVDALLAGKSLLTEKKPASAEPAAGKENK
jgi:thiol-disulfide isomerase/thioredoxin